MPFDFIPQDRPLSRRNRTNYQAGHSAEQAVARAYEQRGAELRVARWRGRCGEIDLIFSKGDQIIFVEVKKSKTHARAAERLSHRQLARITASAEDYLGHTPLGGATPSRIDLALVDAFGAIDVLENVSVMM